MQRLKSWASSNPVLKEHLVSDQVASAGPALLWKVRERRCPYEAGIARSLSARCQRFPSDVIVVSNCPSALSFTGLWLNPIFADSQRHTQITGTKMVRCALLVGLERLCIRTRGARRSGARAPLIVLLPLLAPFFRSPKAKATHSTSNGDSLVNVPPSRCSNRNEAVPNESHRHSPACEWVRCCPRQKVLQCFPISTQNLRLQLPLPF
jgi:hypothetical protein